MPHSMPFAEPVGTLVGALIGELGGMLMEAAADAVGVENPIAKKPLKAVAVAGTKGVINAALGDIGGGAANVAVTSPATAAAHGATYIL